MWWIALKLVLYLSCSHAQLTAPVEAVCSGEPVLFLCQQLGDSVTWLVNLPGMTLRVRAPREVGELEMFPDDPGYAFKVTTTVLGNSSTNSELRVTAVRELDGVRVDCVGFSGMYMSEIQVASIDSPTAPSGVMATVDQSQLSPSTASINLTWSAGSGAADNYTIMMTPPLPSGDSLLSITTTSLQLTVLYNEEYSLNITAHNHCGTNNTFVILSPVVSQCGPPTAPANGHINANYSSTVEGSQITFHCGDDSPVMTSTCTNGHWIPDPDELHCPVTSSVLSAASQVLITATVCSLVFFILGLLVGVLFHYWATVRGVCRSKQSSNNSSTPPVASVPVVYEEVPPVSDSCTERKSDIELRDNLAYVPVGCS